MKFENNVYFIDRYVSAHHYAQRFHVSYRKHAQAFAADLEPGTGPVVLFYYKRCNDKRSGAGINLERNIDTAWYDHCVIEIEY